MRRLRRHRVPYCFNVLLEFTGLGYLEWNARHGLSGPGPKSADFPGA